MPPGTDGVVIVRPESAAQWDAARRLVDEYAASLGIDVSFQNYQREIATLAAEYGPPRGCFALARSSGADMGCGGVRARDAATCEMKRLYVVPAAQGRGIGQAKEIGYDTMVLDTMPGMTGRARAVRVAWFRTDRAVSAQSRSRRDLLEIVAPGARHPERRALIERGLAERPLPAFERGNRAAPPVGSGTTLLAPGGARDDVAMVAALHFGGPSRNSLSARPVDFVSPRPTSLAARTHDRTPGTAAVTTIHDRHRSAARRDG